MSSEQANNTRELKNAVYVTNDLELKTEMGKRTRLIVSTDKDLYYKTIQKWPQAKNKTAKKSKKIGKVLTYLGIGITVASGGVLSGVGLPLAGIGAATGIAGAAIDDYRHYKLFIDYEEKRLVFKRTK